MNIATYETWYDQWLERMNGWAMDCGVKQTAEVVHLIPDLILVTLNLSQDARIPPATAVQLSELAAQIMRGIEFLPSGFAAVTGLVEDAMRIAKVLHPLLPMLDSAVVAEYWHHRRDLPATVDYLLNQSDDFSPRC